MEYPVPSHTPSPAQPTKLVLIRANGALFHSLAAAALLESQAAVGAQRMLRSFGQDAALATWVASEWLPGKIARARVLREYLERTWPEFDFAAALHEFELGSGGDGGSAPQRPGAAHEALARCLASAQSALFYRALSRWTEDPGLRALANGFAEDETRWLARFRTAFEQSARTERMGLARAWCAGRRCVRSVRDSQLPFAFGCLAAHWRPHAPVAPMRYREFVQRMRRVIWQNGDLGLAERVLFAPWARQPRERADARSGQTVAWFRPLLRSA
jgi:hypothetical protein